MSWESTALYYQLINRETARRRGGLHSAPIALVSLDFQVVEKLQRAGDWAAAGQLLAAGARQIENAGAQLLLMCTNSMHIVADTVAQSVSIPLLHLADATATQVIADGHRRVGLLGTRYTMEESFYRGRLTDRHGLEVLVPNEADRTIVHDVIYDELCQGRIEPASRAEYLRIIDQLAAEGATAVIAGCTEIGMLVTQSNTRVPLLDTTRIHALAAVALAMQP